MKVNLETMYAVLPEEAKKTLEGRVPISEKEKGIRGVDLVDILESIELKGLKVERPVIRKKGNFNASYSLPIHDEAVSVFDFSFDPYKTYRTLGEIAKLSCLKIGLLFSKTSKELFHSVMHSKNIREIAGYIREKGEENKERTGVKK